MNLTCKKKSHLGGLWVEEEHGLGGIVNEDTKAHYCSITNPSKEPQMLSKAKASPCNTNIIF